ncbi:MAG TPA: hypothetical protein DEA44_16760 [Firmicutes bacterium]|nr:hypothetical protein [Bacillota bacterium]
MKKQNYFFYNNVIGQQFRITAPTRSMIVANSIATAYNALQASDEKKLIIKPCVGDQKSQS